MTQQQRTVLTVAILSTFVAFLDGTVVNVALPAIGRDFGGGLVVQQFVVDAYLLTLAALILLAGALSDQFGRVKVLRLGLIGFGVTSLLCAAAPNGLVLIIARALQGAAGALLVPSSLALIISAFSGAAQSKALGTWTAWSGMAMIIGPLVGGIFVDTLSWRFVFVVNVLPIALVLWWLTKLERDPSDTRGSIDYPGAALGVVGLAGTVFALIEQQRLSWSSPAVLVPLIVGVIALVYFVFVERRSAHPMMPLSLFGVRNFSVGNLTTFAMYGALSIGSFVITLYLQETAGFSATLAGVTLMPLTILTSLLSSYFGGLAGRIGPRVFMTFGPIIAGSGFLVMLTVRQPLNFWTQMLPGVVLFGLGLAATVAPLTAAVLGGIAEEHAGIGSAINNAVARVAGLIAIAFIGLITAGQLDLAGFHRALMVTAVLLIAAGLISAAGIRNLAKQDAEVPRPNA